MKIQEIENIAERSKYNHERDRDRDRRKKHKKRHKHDKKKSSRKSKNDSNDDAYRLSSFFVNDDRSDSDSR